MSHRESRPRVAALDRPLSMLPLIAALVTVLPAAAAAAPPCTAEEPAATVIEQAGELSRDCPPAVDCWAERHRLLSELLAERPDDLFARRAYQDLYRGGPGAEQHEEEWQRLQEAARRLAEERPDDAAAQYLAGRSYEAVAEGRSRFLRALELEPDFGLAHLATAASYADPGGRKLGEEALPHLARFLDLCPEATGQALRYLEQAGDEALLQRAAGNLEHQLADGLDADNYAQIGRLWDLRFRLAAPAEYDALRRGVAADLERLAALDLQDDDGWWSARRKGLELLGDSERLAALDAAIVERDPCGRTAVSTAVEAWEEENPRPKGEVSDEERQRWALAKLGASDGWIESCPDAVGFRYQRLVALGSGGADSLSGEEVAAEARSFLAAWERRPQGTRYVPSPHIRVADLLVEAGVEPELAIEQARLGLEATDSYYGPLLENEGFDEDTRRNIAGSRAYIMSDALALEARALSQLGRHREAQAAVPRIEALRDELPAGDGDDFGIADALTTRLWRTRARLAQAAGDRLDAAAYLRRAVATSPKNEELAAEGERLWIELGGSVDGWAALVAEAGPQPEEEEQGLWKTKDERLPDFELTDLAGKNWRLTELKGKTLFVNQWATWCGPCRLELPYVQSLHRQLAERDDTLVVTFNLDRNPGVIQPYMDREGFDFPVLLSFDYARLQEDSGIPRNWIIDGDGVLRYEQVGFDPNRSEEEWVAEATEMLTAATEPGGESSGEPGDGQADEQADAQERRGGL